MKKAMFFILTVCLGLLACNDKAGTTLPEISILSPVDSEEFNSGDSVRVHVMVTHDDDLHHVELTLINTSLGVDVWDTLIHENAQSFMFDQKWLAEVTDHTDMRLRVVAEDHNENMASDSVHFHLMP